MMTDTKFRRVPHAMGFYRVYADVTPSSASASTPGAAAARLVKERWGWFVFVEGEAYRYAATGEVETLSFPDHASGC